MYKYGNIISRRRPATVDSSLEEDVGGSSIRRHLRRKRIIDPLFSRSFVVIEIADIDDPQAVEASDLHRPGEPGVMGTYSVPPCVPGDTPSAAGHSSVGVTGVYLPGRNLRPGSLLSAQEPAREWLLPGLVCAKFSAEGYDPSDP
ncbi:unnamed protein product [Lactuca virosa]|uniref:Uncharacterized protein n=1 Tax=Lactuca virosa TaxID=75947 RepID=A0AAU9MWK6_9ASTR|nr:unnamed protein product [Lactuca virosa]